MSENKHTPGPWEISKHDDWETCINMVEPRFQLSGIWKTAAVVYGIEDCGDLGAKVCEANARLIAAAPDLLEACQAALSELYRVSPSRAHPLVRAAIAKATGATP